MKEKYKRIHVQFDDTTLEILGIIATKEKKSLSEVVRTMTEKWMERHEDQYWIDLVAQEPEGKTLSHEEVWENV